MKKLSASFTKLVSLAACALTLGSCSRAEYSMLPKGSSYHNVTRVATPVPTSSVAAVSQASATAPAAAEATTVSVAPFATPVLVAKEAASAPAIVASTAAVVAATASTLPDALPARKLTRVQKFAATRIVRAVSKAANANQFKQHQATAKTEKISGNLRTGVILLLIGLLISLFAGINGVFGLIGGIIAVIGLIFIILYLLDNL